MSKNNLSNNKKTTRVQFEFTDDSIERLQNLVKLTDSTSRAEVVRKALRLYEFVVQQSKQSTMGFEKNGVFSPVLSLL